MSDKQVDKAWEAREQFFTEHGFPEQTDYHRGVSYIAFKAGFEAGRLAALEEARSRWAPQFGEPGWQIEYPSSPEGSN